MKILSSLSGTSIGIKATGAKAMFYEGNYSANFGPRSIVDKGFVTGTTYLTVNNGLTKSGNNFSLGGAFSNVNISSVASDSSAFQLENVNSSGTAAELVMGAASFINPTDSGSIEIVGLDNTVSDTIAGLTIQGSSAKYGVATFDQTSTYKFYLESLADSSNIGTMRFVDNRTVKKGVEYGANYASGFGPRSLIDKAYVTGTTYLTSNNGLSKSGSNFRLGGTLTGSTSISTGLVDQNLNLIGGSGNELSVGNSFLTVGYNEFEGFGILDLFGINSTTQSTRSAIRFNQLGAGDLMFASEKVGQGFNLTFNADLQTAVFTDSRTIKRGIQYAANYSTGFNARSLVDAGYVTGTTYLTANNGLTKSGNNFRLGGTLTGNTIINSTGGTQMFSLRGNGNLIVGSGTITPNTKLDIRGIGSTSGTTIIRLANSSDAVKFLVRDDGKILINQTSLQNTTNLIEINGITSLYNGISKSLQLNNDGKIIFGTSVSSASIGSTTNNTSTFAIAGTSMGYAADVSHAFIVNTKQTIGNSTFSNYRFGGGFNSSAGSGTGTFLHLLPVHTITGGTPTLIGLHYNPSGSLGSATHIAVKTSAGNILVANSSGTTITTNTKIDVRGNGITSGTTILRLADNANTVRFEIRDNGASQLSGNLGIGTTIFPTNTRLLAKGSDVSSLSSAGRFENSVGSLIGQFRNDQVFELGGTSAILEINAGIESGNAALKFLSYTGGTGIGYRFQDSNLNDYVNYRSLTSDRGVVMRQPVEYDYNQGYKRVTKQYTYTTDTTNNAQHVIFEFTLADSEHMDIKVLHSDATATDHASITSLGIDAADVKKVSGSTITGNTIMSTQSKLPGSLSGGFNWNIDTGTNKIQYRFQNHSTGKTYTVWTEISYVKRTTPTDD